MTSVSSPPAPRFTRDAAERGHAADRHPSPGSPGRKRSIAWLLAVLAFALFIAEVPRLIAVCCAPPGATGLGTAWFVNDFAQYESAMRQGAEQPGWLVRDPFTAEPHAAAFMFSLYVGAGKLAAALNLPAAAVEHRLEILARAVLVVALWRFCRAFARDGAAARWAFGLTLFASGFELFGALIGGYAGNWSYEMNGFGLLFAAPHVPLGMAATLELARVLLRPGFRLSAVGLGGIALLASAVALLHPFHAPVLLGAVGLVGLYFWRSKRGAANLVGGIVAGLAALPVLLPTVATFSLDPFWGLTYTAQNVLPSPAPHELLVDLGPLLLLAVLGVVLQRGRVAPLGLLMWLALGLIGMYLPVPYQRRLAFGIQPAMAVLAANGLMAACAALSPASRWAHGLRLAVVAASASGTVLVLVSMVASGFNNAPLPVYRSTSDLDAAAAWLDAQARPDEVILADWDTSNYLAARTPARVFGGHPVATLHPAEKRLQIASVFAAPDSVDAARGLGARWLVYGPDEAQLPAPSDPAFQVGAVRVYRVW